MENKSKVVEVTYGAPDPPDILFARGVLHPHTLSDKITDVIFDILIDSACALPVTEIYKKLCEKGAMEFNREVYLAREHPIIKQIAGACQHLYFSERLEGTKREFTK